jgi:DNA repair exonuclease SbcCD nuclease subunit
LLTTGSGEVSELRLLHAADLHVDSPLRGLSAYPGAPEGEIRSATRRALVNLVDLAGEEDVDAVLLAGDVYDGDWPDYNTGLFFRSQMVRLAEAGIGVYLVSGNHDAASQISRRLSLPKEVRVFDRFNPESAVDEKLDLVVHGQSFKERDVRDNLAVGYPPPKPGYFNVGLLHTALTGRDGHDTYAPCSVEDLKAKGYDYWALGHVHTRETVATEPHIVFPGNTQGRHARETGPKGCVLVDVGTDGRATTDFRELDVVRWAHLEVDAGGAADLDAVLDRVKSELTAAHDDSEGRLLAARVSIVGTSDAHYELWQDHSRLTSEVRGIAGELAQAWVEKVRPATRPADRDGADAASDGLDSLADLRRTASRLRTDDDGIRRLLEDTPLLAKLPPEARTANGIRPEDPEWGAGLFDEAVDLLVAMVEDGAR